MDNKELSEKLDTVIQLLQILVMRGDPIMYDPAPPAHPGTPFPDFSIPTITSTEPRCQCHTIEGVRGYVCPDPNCSHGPVTC